jgi:hypothetical protein
MASQDIHSSVSAGKCPEIEIKNPKCLPREGLVDPTEFSAAVPYYSGLWAPKIRWDLTNLVGFTRC